MHVHKFLLKLKLVELVEYIKYFIVEYKYLFIVVQYLSKKKKKKKQTKKLLNSMKAMLCNLRQTECKS